jgi:glycerophosphoryl diester phosphodiesterase
VIAHRGASFHIPEHTLAAYRLALELGADYIEPDLVGTKDGHLVVVHSIDLNITTNVAEVFPNRITTLPTTNATGYYAHHFTLNEIRQLKVKQSLPAARSQLYDDMFGIPTFQETLQLLEEWNEQVLPLLTDEPTLQRAGLYVELKDPDIYQQMTNRSMVDIFINELQTSEHAKFLQEDSVCDSLKFNQYVPPPMVVQCFSAPTLEEIHKQWNFTTLVTSVLLIHGGPTCFQDDFWFHVGESREYIKGIGVEKKCLLPHPRAVVPANTTRPRNS